MNQAHRPQRFTRRALAAAVIAACAAPAFALDFTTESGWEGNIKTDLSVSQSWRVEGVNKNMVGQSQGQYISGSTAGYGAFNTGNSSDLNFDKGDRYSTLFKIISEVSFSKGDMGGMIRAKAWYDDALHNHGVRYGNQPNGYTKGNALSDDGFESLNRFDGVALLDAYMYKSFELNGKPTQIRVGRQVVNGGESIFILGSNQLSPLDITALNKAGTQIKEALMPVWSITANMGLGDGMSLDAFYQLKWEPYNLETCGTFFGSDGGGSDPGKCNLAYSTSFGGLNPLTANDPAAAALGPTIGYLPYVKHPDPKDSGQWGLSFRFPVEAIDTEFGLHAMNYHSRTPVLGGKASPWNPTLPLNPDPTQTVIAGAQFAIVAGNLGLLGLQTVGVYNGMEAFYEYPEDIRMYALSAATTLGGWSIGSELSYSPNTPAQLSAADALRALLAGDGPIATRLGVNNGIFITPGYKQLYDRVSKTQFQINGLNTLPSMLGASGGLFIAEAAVQKAGIDDSNGTNQRYGRAFAYDAGAHTTYAGGYSDTCDANGIGSAGCKNDGYMTRYSWGYRMMAELNYPGFMGTGWKFTPSVFWSHDVKGTSIDYQFLEDRKTLSLTAGFNLNNQHDISFNYTTYLNSAEYNINRDKDNASVVYRYTF